MQSSYKSTLISVVAIAILVLLAVWWYLGFSLDFMRFFAAEPGVTTVTTSDAALTTCRAGVPAGCTCQSVQCIQAPCDPIVVCPGQCTPRPACLDAVPRPCMIAEPQSGWCPPGDKSTVQCSPATQTATGTNSVHISASNGSGGYQWFAPGGVLSMPESQGATSVGVYYDTPGVKKVTVQSQRASDPTYVDSVACTVIVQ